MTGDGLSCYAEFEALDQGFLSLIIRYSPMALAVFDRDMRYLAASEKWARDYGLDHPHLPGRCHYDLFPEIRKNPDWTQGHRKALAGETHESPCTAFHCANGNLHDLRWESRPWRTASGGVGGLVVFSEIVTGQRLQTQELERQRRFMARAQHIAKVGYWRLDLRNNDLFWSEEVYAIHGLDPLTFYPRIESAINAYHPDDRAVVESIINNAIRMRESFDFRMRLVRPSGEIRLVRAQGECEYNAQNAVIGLFGVFKDLTEDRKLHSAILPLGAQTYKIPANRNRETLDDKTSLENFRRAYLDRRNRGLYRRGGLRNVLGQRDPRPGAGGALVDETGAGS